MKNIVLLLLILLNLNCFSQKNKSDSIKELMRSNHPDIFPELSKKSLSEIQGNWRVVGIFKQLNKPSILAGDFFLEISESTIEYRFDTSSFSASYELFFDDYGNQNKYSLIQLDVKLDFNEVYLLEYFDSEFMVFKRYIVKGDRKKLKFNDYYFLERT